MFEIELYFGGDEPHMIVDGPIDVSCPTVLMNYAYDQARKLGAEHVSFGPVIPRGEDGLPKTKGRER